MRRYKIEIDGGDTYDSAPNGVPDPGALRVEMDLSVIDTTQASPAGAFVRIWGVGVDKLSQAHNLFNKTITISGGMAKGLPLAKPDQYGLLLKGTIYNGFGNWVGTNQSLDIYVNSLLTDAPTPDGGSNPPKKPQNIVVDWKKDQKLSEAVQQALKTAFPGKKIKIDIGKDITATQDQPAYFGNLEELGYWVKRQSQSLGGKGYQGHTIWTGDGDINYGDGGGNSSDNINIAFEDLIGQPTWIAPGTIQVHVVMRGGLKLQQKITLPKTWVNAAGQNSTTQGKTQQLTFTGSFTIKSLRHVGDSRASSGEAWITIIEANAPEGSPQQ